MPVHAISARTGDGMEKLHAYPAGHHTVALLGPSGAGKSTLVNALVGDEVQRTGVVRRSTRRAATPRRRPSWWPCPTVASCSTPAGPASGGPVDDSNSDGEGGGGLVGLDDITALAEGLAGSPTAATTPSPTARSA